MNEKQHILDELAEVFNRWQSLLAGLSEQQIHTPLAPSSWTVKDLVAHLWSWQQASVARAEAALQNKQPNYPRWWEIFGPDPEKELDRTNAWLYEASRDKPWATVYVEWKTQFTHYLELIRQVTEKDFLQAGRYPWMGKYALADSSTGSLEHHKEHYDILTKWLKDHGDLEAGG